MITASSSRPRGFSRGPRTVPTSSLQPSLVITFYSTHMSLIFFEMLKRSVIRYSYGTGSCVSESYGSWLSHGPTIYSINPAVIQAIPGLRRHVGRRPKHFSRFLHYVNTNSVHLQEPRVNLDSIIRSQCLSRNPSRHLRHLVNPSRDHRHSQTHQKNNSTIKHAYR
jgi:hypothetical protein